LNGRFCYEAGYASHPCACIRPARSLDGHGATVEPGIYVRPAKGVPIEFWNIGIRIEDDALATARGCEPMTREAPMDADEIEALMRG
jgi:Xaa-Pro aminopeptidase